MERRQFLKSSVGLGVLTGLGSSVITMGSDRLGEEAREKEDPTADGGTVDRIGHPVRVVSIGFKGTRPLKEVAELVNKEGAQGADLIALPENDPTVAVPGNDPMAGGRQETLNGPTISTMSTLAKKHQTYIACPLDRKDGKLRFNSVVLLDRSGQVACVYDKVFPWLPECGLKPPVSPGKDTIVHQADFGRVGFATCFDIYFPEVWQRLGDQGAELVIWSSDYSGGTTLQAHALDFHYYIVSCTHFPDCVVFDVTGEKLFYHRGADINVSRITLDLDRGLYGTDYNLPKRDKLLKEHAEDVIQERWMPLEEFFVLKAKKPGISARKLAQDYGLIEIRDLLTRSRLQIDGLRGWAFAKKSWGEPRLG